jgi:hypothetical protein
LEKSTYLCRKKLKIKVMKRTPKHTAEQRALIREAKMKQRRSEKIVWESRKSNHQFRWGNKVELVPTLSFYILRNNEDGN